MYPENLTTLVRDGDLSSLRALLDPLPRPVVAALLVAPDHDGHTALHWAAMAEHPSLLDYFLTYLSASDLDAPSAAVPQLRQTPLHWACVTGNLRAVVALRRAGADLSRRDAKGYTPAIHAAQYGRVAVLHDLAAAAPPLLRDTDDLGNGALQWAAYYDHLPAVRYLLVVHAAAPDHLDKSRMSALHRAAQGDRLLVADALLRAGADATLPNADGLTPLQLATPHSRVASLLASWESGALSVAQPAPPRHTVRRHGLVIFFVALLIISYGAYHSRARSTALLPLWAHIVFHVALVIVLVSHARATFGDPGDLRRGNRESLIRYIEQSIEKGNSDISLLPSAYCFTCLAPRPPRSKHSRDRDVCVRLFDHECPWVNNTVGLYNHKPLLLLALSTAVAEGFYIFAMVRFLYTIDERSAHGMGRAMYHYPVVTLTTLAHGGVAVFCIALFVTHLRLIMRGQTTYEHLSSRRDSRAEVNPYDHGPCRNLWNFLSSSGPGTHKKLSTLSPQLVFNSLSSTFSNDNTDRDEAASAKLTTDIDIETGRLQQTPSEVR